MDRWLKGLGLVAAIRCKFTAGDGDGNAGRKWNPDSPDLGFGSPTDSQITPRHRLQFACWQAQSARWKERYPTVRFLQEIQHNWFLVSIVNNDFKGSFSLWTVFDAVIAHPDFDVECPGTLAQLPPQGGPRC